MSNSELNTLFSLTAPVVMAHPNLFEPKAFKGPNGKETGDPKYSANLVFAPDSPDLKALKTLAAQVAKAKWADRALNTLVFPFSSGDKLIANRVERLTGQGKDYDNRADYQKGMVVMAARSKFQPKLAVLEGGRIIELDDEAKRALHKGKFYFGVQVLAQINFATHQVGNNTPGVNAYLNMVLSTNKGEKLAGGATASEVFKGYVGAHSTVDPTGGASVDDEIPF